MRIFRRITENIFDLAYKGARRAPFFVPFLNVKTGAVIFSASVFILCSKSVLFLTEILLSISIAKRTIMC